MTAQTFSCRVGLIPGFFTPSLWVESPRTGKRLNIGADEVRDRLPSSIRAKIEAAVNAGQLTAELTTDELKAFKSASEWTDYYVVRRSIPSKLTR